VVSETRGATEAGFTIVELLVTMVVLSIATVAMYQILFSVAEGTRTTESLARISDEARLGFNRMVRDTREGQEIRSVIMTNPSSFTVGVDFDGNGVITGAPAENAAGDYEELTYSFDSGTQQIRLNGELLMSGVGCVGACSSNPVFDYASTDLRYDWNSDGVTTWQELDDAPAHGVVGVGNDNDVLDSSELAHVTSVTFRLLVTKGDSSSSFYARAQLRNKR
jgi:prepilin-type N-terminal cleavage/methylation domain-containing protein